MKKILRVALLLGVCLSVAVAVQDTVLSSNYGSKGSGNHNNDNNDNNNNSNNDNDQTAACLKVPVTLHASWRTPLTDRPMSPHDYEWTVRPRTSSSSRDVLWRGLSAFLDDNVDNEFARNHKTLVPVGSYVLHVRVQRNPHASQLGEDLTHPIFVLRIGSRTAGFVRYEEHDRVDTWKLAFQASPDDCPAARPPQNHRVLQTADHTPGVFPVKVQIEGDAFPDENAWTLMRREVDDESVVRYLPILHSATGVSGSTAVEPGAYAFEMTDMAGDGICCSFGLGVFRVTVGDTTAYIGGEFGSTTGLLEFTVTPSGGVMLPGSRPTPPVSSPPVPAPPVPRPTLRPSNPVVPNACTDAQEIVLGEVDTIRGSNELAPVVDPESPVAGCASFAPGLARAVYYSFVGDGCRYSVTTFHRDTNYDTVLGVLESDHGCNEAICIADNDDSDALLTSRVRFQTVAGRNYWLVVGGFSEQTGTYVLTFMQDGECGPTPQPFPTVSPYPTLGDQCVTAEEIDIETVASLEGSLAGLPVLTGDSAATACQIEGAVFNPGLSRIAYYSFLGNGCTYFVSNDELVTDYASTIGLLRGTDCSDEEVECETQSGPFEVEIEFETEVGDQYWLAIGGVSDSVGNYRFEVSQVGSCTPGATRPPAMVQTCEDATMIVLGDGNQEEGSTDNVAPLMDNAPAAECRQGSAIFSPGTTRAIYLRFVGDGCSYAVDTRFSNFDTVLGLLSGDSCGNVMCAAVNDDFFGLQSQIQFETVPGATYWLILGGFSDSTGDYFINFALDGSCGAQSVKAVPYQSFGSPKSIKANVGSESCDDAPTLELAYVIQDQGSTRNVEPIAEGDPAVACRRGAIFSPGASRVVYYSITGDGCPYTADTFGSGYDTTLGLLVGSSCDDVSCVVRNDDTNGLQSRISFELEAGVSYWLIIGGFSASRGTYILNMSRDTVCGPSSAPTTGFPSVVPTTGFPSVPPTPAPSADGVVVCEAAPSIDLMIDPFSGSTEGVVELSRNSPAVACGEFIADITAAVYFEFVGDGNCYTIDTVGSDYDTILGVLVGDECDSVSCLVMDDDSAGNLLSRIFVETTVDQRYWLLVGGFDDSQGNYVVNIVSGCDIPEPPPPPGPDPTRYNIQLFNAGTVTAFDRLMTRAARRWEELIVNDLPGGEFTSDPFNGQFATTYIGPYDDLVIGYEFAVLPAGILGQAGITTTRSGPGTVGFSSSAGIMLFDTAFFLRFPTNSAYLVVLHEIGHLLGVGSLWNQAGCDSNCRAPAGGSEFTCENARRQYEDLKLFPPEGTGSTLLLNLEGGPGSVCSHWSDESFGAPNWSEIMTAFFDEEHLQLLTGVSVGSLADLNSYVVNYTAVDPVPPEGADLSRLGYGVLPDFTFDLDKLMLRHEQVVQVPEKKGNGK